MNYTNPYIRPTLFVLMAALIPFLGYFGCNRTDKERKSDGRPVKLYLVARPGSGLEGEQIGCNDSLVSIEDTLNGAESERLLPSLLTHLFNRPSDQKRYTSVGGLQVDSVLWQSPVHVFLRGHPRLRGVCDQPRIRQQLYRTARQLPGIDSVRFYINGRSLEAVLSLKGG